MNQRQYNLIPPSFATFQRTYPEDLDKALTQFISDISTEYAVPIIEDQSMCIISGDYHQSNLITFNIRYKLVPKRYI